VSSRASRTLWFATVAVVVAMPAPAVAQREVDVRYGRWYGGNAASTYELKSRTGLTGAVSQEFGLTILVSDPLGRRRAFYGLGWELQFFRGSQTLGPYALVGAAIGLSTDTANEDLGVLWNVGGGVEWRPVNRVALGVETRYRFEDRGPRGFWSHGGTPRKGISLSLGLAVGLGRGHGGGATTRPGPARIPPEPPATVTGRAADVVRTALDALGTPYQWGGTADNGFDCSGLIQYAYGQHGIRLPRTSRDQAHAGTEVTPVLDALQPGDILLFSARPGAGVTHVGMYLGDHKFVHSASTGVKISVLDPGDPEGSYWVPRWVGARRVMP
jgi:cell wall-associated NlpC family hydrolase